MMTDLILLGVSAACGLLACILVSVWQRLAIVRNDRRRKIIALANAIDLHLGSYKKHSLSKFSSLVVSASNAYRCGDLKIAPVFQNSLMQAEQDVDAKFLRDLHGAYVKSRSYQYKCLIFGTDNPLSAALS